MDEQKPHKRRARYSGTHPKRFEEKYKERDPEKYADTIEHVIQRGATPAGMCNPAKNDDFSSLFPIFPVSSHHHIQVVCCICGMPLFCILGIRLPGV